MFSSNKEKTNQHTKQKNIRILKVPRMAKQPEPEREKVKKHLDIGDLVMVIKK